MIKQILGICILTLIWSCNNSTSTTSTPEDEVTTTDDVVVTDEPAEPTVEDDKSEAVIQNAPEYMNLELQGYDTPNINLKNLYGKVVFLNHWGSWCPPCRREMPSIQTLYDDYGDKVEFVMIATEKRPGAHIPYIQENGFTFPVYSMNSPASTEVKPKGYPTTIILDKEGNIETYEVGAADWNSNHVREFLDKLLSE